MALIYRFFALIFLLVMSNCALSQIYFYDVCQDANGGSLTLGNGVTVTCASYGIGTAQVSIQTGTIDNELVPEGTQIKTSNIFSIMQNSAGWKNYIVLSLEFDQPILPKNYFYGADIDANEQMTIFGFNSLTNSWVFPSFTLGSAPQSVINELVVNDFPLPAGASSLSANNTLVPTVNTSFSGEHNANNPSSHFRPNFGNNGVTHMYFLYGKDNELGNGARSVFASQDFDILEIADDISDLSITKTANQMAANVGSTITFTIEVTNDGPNETSNVVVQDLLQSGFQYTSSSASQGSYNNATGIWTVGNLNNNESAQLTITATVLANGNYFNQAQITNSSSDDPDSDPDTGFNTDDLNDNIADDDEATVTIDVNHPPIANPDQFSTDQDNSLSFTILPNDSDVDGNLDPSTTNITCGLCSGAGNGTVTNNGNGNFTYVPNNGFTGTDNFIYQICDDMGLCDTALVTITINATQSCTETCEAIFAVNDVCVDETFTLNAAASTSCSASNIISYTWDFGDGNTSSSAIDSHVYTLPGNYDILLIIENDSNCIDSLTLSIEAKPLPTVNLSAFNDLCETSSPITLNQGSPAGGVYSGTGVVGNTFNPAMAGVGNHIITYVFTNNVGCSNKASNTIVVYPAYSILQPTIQNCDSVIVNGNWYSTSQTVIDTLASYHLCDSLVITPIIIEDVIMANQTAVKGCDSLLYLGNWYTSSTTVNDTSISSTGCDSISITPIIISSDQFIIAPEITTCDSVNINGNWYSSSQLVTDTLLSFNSCDSIVATQVTLANETIVYQTAIEQCDSVLFMNNWYFSSIDVYDTLTAINGCDSINITPLIINQAVTANLNAFEDICINSNTLILTGESPSGGEFSGIGVSNNTFNPSVSGVGNFEIVYTYTDSNNCISSASQFISVNGIGNDTIEYVLCEEGETFNLPNGGTVNSPGTYTDTILSSNNCDSIVVVILESFNETCLDDCFLTAPSAFTPDNDGLNDIFYIIANCTYEFEKFDFRIYNRWGEEVFKSNDINNGWDGTYKNVDVPLDVYSFIVNYSYFENKIFYGIITVIR